MIQKVAAELADKFSTIQPRPDAEDRDRLLADLRKENLSLKDEKETLLARINNLEYMLTNLQNKVKAANDEKSCLIPTIRLLREDIVAEGKDNYPDNSSRQGKSGLWSNATGRSIINQQHQNITEISNRYEVLTVADNDSVFKTRNDSPILVEPRVEQSNPPKHDSGTTDPSNVRNPKRSENRENLNSLMKKRIGERAMFQQRLSLLTTP